MLKREDIAAILPRKRIAPVTFHLGAGRTVFLGGLARLDVLTSDKPVFLTVFASNKLSLHSTSTRRAEEIYERNRGEPLLSPPTAITVRGQDRVAAATAPSPSPSRSLVRSR